MKTTRNIVVLFLALTCLLFWGYGCGAANGENDDFSEVSAEISAPGSSPTDSSANEAATSNGSLPGVPIAENIYGDQVTTETEESLLEIRYVLQPYSVEKMRPEVATFLTRSNVPAYGLSKFCPTISYVFPNDKAYDSFLDIHVREKGGAVDENFASLSYFVSPCVLTWQGGSMAEQTVTVDSYDSAEDFFQKNYGAAMQGDDLEYTEFTRLENVTIGGSSAYHYSYFRNVEPDSPEKGIWDIPATYERFSEQYLLETEKYIYVFAFSGQKNDERLLRRFREIVDSIEINADTASKPPVWAQSHAGMRLKRSELVGNLPACLEPYLSE